MRKKGFTLIELILSLAIASVIILVISTIISVNSKVLKDTYDNEIGYKESSINILYINNVIEAAYKIEMLEENGMRNFKAYVISKGTNEITTYRFYTRNKGSKSHLFVYLDNISNNSKRGKDLNLGKCDDFYCDYDLKNQFIKIVINRNSPIKRYETSIYVGNKIWKKDFYQF